MKKGFSLFILLFAVMVARSQDGRDSFSIPWPNEYHWKVYNQATHLKLPKIKTENYDWVDYELIPETETLENWTIDCRVSVYTTNDSNYYPVIENKKISEVKKNSPKAVITVIDKGQRWNLFKIESIVSKNDNNAESELCYILCGAWGHVYVTDIIVKKEHLDNEFTTTWTKILKSNEYRYW
jgi:hypothetical protein